MEKASVLALLDGSDSNSATVALNYFNQMLGERLYLYCLARFLVVGAIAVGALFAANVVGIRTLDVPKLLGVAAALGLYNTVVFLMLRPLRDRERADANATVLTGVMHGTIMLDFIFLTIALWLVGGARSPFQAFYLFNVILASVFLSRASAFAHTLFGYLLLAGLVVGEWLEWIPACVPTGAVVGEAPIDGRYVVTLLVVYGVLFALSAVMLTSLVHLLRAGERKLRYANAQLEHLSTMRRDFLQMVLHDLKTPLVAVAQHLINIEAQLHDHMSDQEARWLARCQTRMREVSDFLSDLQVLSVLESDGVRRQAKPVDVNALLNTLVAESQDLARLRNHALTVEIPEPLPQVQGVERLLREALLNLITNAVKYTPSGGKIAVRGLRRNGRIRIEVQDNGVGISIEDQKRLFQEFSRIRPSNAAKLDVTGSSGLGLAIVRRIVELHGGTVAVDSELNRGSTFIVELPASSTGA